MEEMQLLWTLEKDMFYKVGLYFILFNYQGNRLQFVMFLSQDKMLETVKKNRWKFVLKGYN